MNILSTFDTFFNEAKKNKSSMNLDSKLRSKEQLAARGLPTRKDEAWRNTSLKFLNEIQFAPQASAPLVIAESLKTLLESKKIPGSQYLVFVNGFCLPLLSKFDARNMTVQQSQKMSPDQPDSNPLRSLNSLYNLSPIEIVIENDLQQPIQIINLTHSADGGPVISVPKIGVTLKSNMEAKVVITHGGDDQASYFSNGRFSFTVEKDARLEIVNYVNQSINAYHFDDVSISAEKASTVRYFELNFNALMTRHEFTLDINGEHIQSEILSASYLKHKQHCDSQTFINHNQSHSKSEQVYKALLDDQSRSVFSGTVYIAKGVVKADSAQLNQNLLLTDQAEVNSKPVLRIYADDVKASHGSTMGQIQEDEIFYLQSRSISRSKAIELLGQGFLNEIVLRLGSNDLKQYFAGELLREFGANRKLQLKVLKQ